MSKNSKITTKKRKKANKRGQLAEVFAATYLILKGYKVLKRRYKTPLGEIDLIVRKGKVIAFVEVKARKTLEDAAYSITDRQKKRIEGGARVFLGNNPNYGEYFCRFDAILVVPMGLPTHITNAW
jgi:putative endonuclease